MKLNKAYSPKDHEQKIYNLWEKSRAFAPKNRGSEDYFSIVVPPPNANGDLHIGHALTLVLEDIAVRYHRLKGEAALLLPGADHAGFETQVVYEKQLAKEGKSRFDFSREELYKHIWEFVANNKSNYETQFRRLGAGVDWMRYTYTLDEKIVKTAYTTFKKMWDEGLIYRGERLVNFCTFHGTGFADIEVEYKEVAGKMWHIRYPLTDGSGEVVVATTRPETVLGDVAVAVHPDDPRYKKIIGKTIHLPLTNRQIPVIADVFVDREFGTGAVKITPAHDPNDFEVAQRNDLPMIPVIDHEGKMTHEVPGSYRNLEVKAARKKVVVDLEAGKFLAKTVDHTYSVGHCYKCGTVIQPLLREQWFVDMKPLAERAIKVLRAGKITFYPEAKKDQLCKYLEGLRDWNISRQIAWGIPIPAFQNTEVSDDWIFDERVDKEEITVDNKTYRRDPDVFDTWFSSSSWPYATLDFPHGADFKKFYPLSVMETGGEILYPWVSRMIMLGLYVTGEIPFRKVYIHGYVMAEDGAKMSKSIGNVVDPMPVIEQYGSDALRMGIIAGRVPAVNRGYDHRKVEEARNFCNKLWNVARFIEDKVGEDHMHKNHPRPTTNADHWILTKLQHITGVMGTNLDNYRFGEAYENLYHFVWDDFADWYIEASKSETNPGLLAFGLETILKLAHPFAPFVTETIWQALGWEKGTLATATWPTVPDADKAKTKAFEQLKSVVSEIRYLSTELKLPKPTLLLKKTVEDQDLIKRLARLGAIEQSEQGSGLRLTSMQAWLDVNAATVREFVSQLKAKATKQVELIKRLEGRLKNQSYVKNAPQAVIAQSLQQLSDAQKLRAAYADDLKRFA